MINHASSLGDRIAYYRRRLGLSQVEFAALIDRSESWVSQVERGQRRIDRMSVLQKVADALNVAVTELRPGEAESTPHTSYARPAGLDDLRLALSGHPAVDMLFGAKRDASSSLDQLAKIHATIWSDVHGGDYAELSEKLVRLVSTLERMLRSQIEPANKNAAQLMLSDTYQAAAAMLAKLAEHDAAWIAADRAANVAEQLDDPLMVTASLFRMAHVFMSLRQLAQAQQVATDAADALVPRTKIKTATPETLSLYGALNLVLAVVAARDNRRPEAQDHLQIAREVADRVGPDRNDFGTEFGPKNVTLHAVAIAVELGDAGSALDLARDVDLQGLSAERQARFLIDVARAQAMRRQAGEALQSVLRAEQIAPDQTRSLRTAIDLVRDLVQLAGTRVRPELADLARRLDVDA